MRAFHLNLGASLMLAATFVSFAQRANAQIHPRDTNQTASSSVIAGDDQYRIGPGDVLEVRVFNRPQLSRDAVRVDGRGLIEMPLLEQGIAAACKTESEVAHDIAAHYLRYQRNPHVSIFVKEFNSQPVAVIGAVLQPGRFQLQRRVRLLELLAFAGGPTERAGEHVNIVRTADVPCPASTAAMDRSESVQSGLISFKLEDVLKGYSATNPYVQPGDVVSMPEAEQAFVVGNVLKPTAINLKEPITITRAIAMAGGVMPDTKLNRVRIVRQSQAGNSEAEIFVDLTAIEKHESENVVLRSGDIVDVATAGGKRFFRTLFSAFAPALASAPVRVVH
jgi:polysaccharide export outer membrane protein